MGHREDLLDGAKRCLFEKGYARTTARDIVAASGTNLASIGYHFGSKEALLNAALIASISEMSAELIRASRDERTGPDRNDLTRGWTNVIDGFDKLRPLLIAQIEAWAQIARSSELSAQLADFYESERVRGVELAQQAAPGLDDHTARAVASVTGALADGLLVQWLLDPERSPTGAEVTLGLKALSGVIADDAKADTGTEATEKDGPPAN